MKLLGKFKGYRTILVAIIGILVKLAIAKGWILADAGPEVSEALEGIITYSMVIFGALKFNDMRRAMNGGSGQ